MDYKVKEVSGSFVVEEIQTGQIVYSSKNKQESKKMMKHLNLGGGFSGFTPTFFLQSSSTALNNISKNM